MQSPRQASAARPNKEAVVGASKACSLLSAAASNKEPIVCPSKACALLSTAERDKVVVVDASKACPLINTARSKEEPHQGPVPSLVPAQQSEKPDIVPEEDFAAKMPSIRDEVSFEKRAAEAHRIRVKYPNRIPVICEKAPRSDLPIIDKKKFLVPMNMLVGEFKYIIHKHINQCAQNSGLPLTHEKTIYLFVENTAPKAGALMQEVYDQHVSDDGFLYVEYSSENALGALPLQSHWNRSRTSTGGRYLSSSRAKTPLPEGVEPLSLLELFVH